HFDRGNADLVMGLQAGVRAGAVAVDADFTFADYPVNPAARQVSELTVHEVVQALSGLVFCDLQMTDGRARFRAALHNLLPGRIVIGVRHCFYETFESILRRVGCISSHLRRPRLAARSRIFMTVSRKIQAPHVSWSSIIEAIVLGRQDCAAGVERLEKT